ncbi:unnamed protein product [Rhodiola kirilowii]
MQIITNPPPKYRRRSSYGTSRRSILKKSFNQEQVNFTSPIPHDPLVAIIGGGISGLLCALSLEKRGIRSTVFDTGVHGLGGSLGTRVIEPQQLLFDHAAQFFTGTVGKIEVGGKFTLFPSSPPRYVGVNGMRRLADSILHQSLDLSSIWALMAAFEDPLPTPVPLDGAFVEGVDSLSWMANNTEKLLSSKNKGPHCWTFFSTAAYAKRNKVPQENIPNVTAEKVKAGMLEGDEVALGYQQVSIQSHFTAKSNYVSRGAALPTNTPGIPCIFDPYGRAGICGDWLLGSSIESAALSGIALGDQIADYFQSGTDSPDKFSVGLEKEFQPLKGHDIGQFLDWNLKASTKGIPILSAHCLIS